MKKQIYLHVPEPCHEDWNIMTPVQQGRFCQSCSKQVTDFSLMSDNQILETLSKAAGSTCGRFAEDQLQRPMVKEIPYNLKPYKIFLSAFIPAFLLANTSNAQQLQGKVKATTEQVSCDRSTKGEVAIMGDTVMGTSVQVSRSSELSGKVTDEEGNPLAGASVVIVGTKNGMAAKEDGSFSLTSRSNDKTLIKISYVGYESRIISAVQLLQQPTIKLEIRMMLTGLIAIAPSNRQAIYDEPRIARLKGKVVNEQGEGLPYASVKVDNYGKDVVSDSLGNFEFNVIAKSSNAIISATHVGYNGTTKAVSIDNDDTEDLVITLQNNEALDSVIVVSYPTTSCSVMLGGISIVSRVTRIDTAKTFFAKVLNSEMFKVYPNPVIKGSQLRMAFKQPGEYSIQLFDNSGKLYLSKESQVENTKSPVELTLPSNLATGAYYIKAVATLTKKQFIDKIIVQ